LTELEAVAPTVRASLSPRHAAQVIANIDLRLVMVVIAG